MLIIIVPSILLNAMNKNILIYSFIIYLFQILSNHVKPMQMLLINPYNLQVSPSPPPLSVPWKFGLITCLAGFIGVVSGSETARLLRPSRGAAGDPLVCAFGMLCSAPFLFAACYTASHNINVTWVSLGFVEWFRLERR